MKLENNNRPIVGGASNINVTSSDDRQPHCGNTLDLPELEELHADTQLIDASDDDGMKRAAQLIREGGLVGFPTETVYGLGANALDADAAALIYKAKGRPSNNPLIVHLADPEDAERYCVTEPMYYKLAEAFMPGPLTVILPKRMDNGSDHVPSATTGGLDTVALRVPSHPCAHRLIELAGVPIAAPSANLSGRPSPSKAGHVVEDMFGRIGMIIDGGECEFGLESTIVKLDGGVTLLRPGGITLEMLREVCGEVKLGKGLTGKFEGRPEAPGMMYRHYAPHSPVILLDGDDAAVYAYLADKTNCGILCYDEDSVLLSRDGAMSLGRHNDPLTHAHRLFDCLRRYDSTDYPVIYARLPDKDGIGLAVYNRLIKAAGYEVISL